MSFGVLVDVAIGIVFVYLLFSLLASILQEQFAALLNRRGRLLEEGLRSMFDDSVRASFGRRLWDFFRISRREGGAGLAGDVLGHGLLRSVMRDERLPSYLSSDQVAKALLDVLSRSVGDARPTPDGLKASVERLPVNGAREALRAIIATTGGQPDLVEKQVAQWFDQVQERVSGWYRREVQVFLLLFGLVIAGAFNVDSFHIASQLVRNSDLRARVVTEAARVDPDTYKDQQQKLVADIANLKLPMGWPLEQVRDQGTRGQIAADVAQMLAGWVVTALALSMGAPLWFDLLQKLLRLRAAGLRPEARPDDAVAPRTALAAAPAEMAPGSAPDTPDGPRTPFERTALSATDIRDLQRALGLPESQVTQDLDVATRVRIREVQRRIGAAATGEVDEVLLAAVRERAGT